MDATIAPISLSRIAGDTMAKPAAGSWANSRVRRTEVPSSPTTVAIVQTASPSRSWPTPSGPKVAWDDDRQDQRQAPGDDLRGEQHLVAPDEAELRRAAPRIARQARRALHAEGAVGLGEREALRHSAEETGAPASAGVPPDRVRSSSGIPARPTGGRARRATGRRARTAPSIQRAVGTALRRDGSAGLDRPWSSRRRREIGRAVGVRSAGGADIGRGRRLLGSAFAPAWLAVGDDRDHRDVEERFDIVGSTRRLRSSNGAQHDGPANETGARRTGRRRADKTACLSGEARRRPAPSAGR